MSTVLDLAFIALCVSLALTSFRLLRGPTIPDRAVAGDQVSIHVVMMIVVYSMSTNQPLLIDLVIVTAIVGFLSLAVVGIYLKRVASGKVQAYKEAKR